MFWVLNKMEWYEMRDACEPMENPWTISILYDDENIYPTQEQKIQQNIVIYISHQNIIYSPANIIKT